jgi:hypothetical protein
MSIRSAPARAGCGSIHPYGSTQTISTETDQIVVTAKPTGLAAGTYSAVVYIVESGPNNFSNTLRIPVTFTIAAGQTAAAAPSTPTQSSVTTPPPPPPSPTATASGGDHAFVDGTQDCQCHGQLECEYRVGSGRVSDLRRDAIGQLWICGALRSHQPHQLHDPESTGRCDLFLFRIGLRQVWERKCQVCGGQQEPVLSEREIEKSERP